MRNIGLKHRKRKGVVLIISVAILALVAMIATSFAINMQVEYRGAVNYLNSARATAMAQAGIDKAIADIRNWVANSSYSTVINNINSYYPYPPAETALGDGFYQVTIGDDTVYMREDQKININALEQSDSVWIDALLGAGLTDTNVGRIIDYRDPDTTVTTQLLTSAGVVSISGPGGNETNSKNAAYATVEEVRLVLNNDTKYNAIKNMATVYAPILKGGLIGSYYSDRYTFDKDTILDLTRYRGKVVELGAVREPLAAQDGLGNWGPWGTFPDADGIWSGWAEGQDATWAGGYIGEDFFVGFGLDQVGVIFTGFIYIPESKVGQAINFYIRSENGVDFSVDGISIIQDWSSRGADPEIQGARTFTRAGWHPTRIKYFNITSQNVLELRWDALGSKDYVPAEYLGYYPASYYGKQYNYYTKALYAPTSTTGTLYTGYNSAGIFKITSKGRVKRSDGALLAEKQITTVVRVFDTWIQSTRAEFYAPWFSLYGDFSDGEVRNVTWLDSCPTDTDYLDTSVSPKRMHWEGSYATVVDSLKLGYWDNADDDVGYTVINFKGGKMTTITGASGWVTKRYSGKNYQVPTGFNYTDVTSTTTFGEMGNTDGVNGSHCLSLWNTAYRERFTEINGNYYAPGLPNGLLGNLGYDIFVRSWVYDNGQKEWGSLEWGYPASNRRTNLPVPPNIVVYAWEYLEPHLGIKRPKWTAGGDPNPSYWYTMLKDGDDDLWYGDENELTFTPSLWYNVPATYSMDASSKKAIPYILAAVGVGTKYESFYSYQTATGGDAAFVGGQSRTSPNSTYTGIVQLNSSNMGSIDSGWGDATAIEAVATRNGYPPVPDPDWYGSDSEDIQGFDNIRIIYPKGYLVSTPCVAKHSTDNSTIKWGTVSWTATTPANTSITMYIRSADALAPTDNFPVTSVSNGASLSANTGRNLQYKALLATTALTTTATVPNAPAVADYQNSSATPVLRDITVTYLSPLETLYRK